MHFGLLSAGLLLALQDVIIASLGSLVLLGVPRSHSLNKSNYLCRR
jgi:hypothetical protein